MLLGFVLTVIGVALGMVLATLVLCALMLNKKVLGWYMGYVNRITNDYIEMAFDKKEAQ